MNFSRNVCRCLCKQIFGFLLPKIQHSWFLKNRDSKKQTQKAWLSDIAIFFHVQIHCACQWIMTLPPKILWPTALLNTWNIITFPKSSFYHTNHTFLTNINVWMMDFWSINTRIKKNSSAQNTILCREWLLQKLTFRHSEITIFNHSQNPTQRTFGEPPAPSVYISLNGLVWIQLYSATEAHWNDAQMWWFPNPLASSAAPMRWPQAAMEESSARKMVWFTKMHKIITGVYIYIYICRYTKIVKNIFLT